MKKKFQFCSCLFLMLHIVTAAFAQSGNKIAGRVMDDAGRPVPYASILSIKKNLYSRSDTDGYFSLGNGVKSGDTIICSHINYYTGACAVQGNDTINFMLTKKHSGTTYRLYFYNIKAKPTQTFNLNHYDSLKLSLRHKPGLHYEDVDGEVSDFLSSIEIPAIYRKGKDSLQALFARSFTLPVNFKQQGVITVRMAITKEGKLENVVLLKGISRGMDQAVLQWCRQELADKCYSAEQNGRKVGGNVDIQFCF